MTIGCELSLRWRALLNRERRTVQAEEAVVLAGNHMVLHFMVCAQDADRVLPAAVAQQEAADNALGFQLVFLFRTRHMRLVPRRWPRTTTHTAAVTHVLGPGQSQGTTVPQRVAPGEWAGLQQTHS